MTSGDKVNSVRITLVSLLVYYYTSAKVKPSYKGPAVLAIILSSAINASCLDCNSTCFVPSFAEWNTILARISPWKRRRKKEQVNQHMPSW